MNTSLSILLKQYKEGNLSEEEVIQLIEDLYKCNNFINPYPYTPYWPQITYETPVKFPEYKITCNI